MQPLSLITSTGIHPTAKLYPRTDLRGRRPFADAARLLGTKVRGVIGSGDYEINDSSVPIMDQKNLGACVLNARAADLEIVLALEGLPFAPLSRLFQYWLCSVAMGTLGQDTGTEVSLACERTRAIGVCEERLWAYTDDPATFFVPPPEAIVAVLEGADNKPTADLHIDESTPTVKADQMETAVKADHPVQVGSPVDASIQSYQPGQVLTRPDPNAIIGGHSWLVVGVRYVAGKRQWKCRNSWGMWGDKGYFWIDEDFVEAPDFSDLNVLTRLDPLLF